MPLSALRLSLPPVFARVGLTVLALVAAAAGSLSAAGASAPSPAADAAAATPAETAAPIGLREAAILGVVEGVTEFLPVSSTGHLILTNRLLGLDNGAPVVLDDGRTVTRKAAADAYAVIIQAGAIAAVLLLYRRRAVQMVAGLLGRDPAGQRLLRNLLVAFLPAVVLGLTLDDLIESYLFGPAPVAAALAIGSIAMVGADVWNRRRHPESAAAAADPAGDPLADLSWPRALGIGLAQCAAMWPGMSRSMSAMVGGYLAGLRPAAAAEFSFLLGLPTLGGAAAYKLLQAGPVVLAVFGWGPALAGAVLAGLSAAVAVRAFVGLIERWGLTPFAVYRMILAIAVALFLV